MPRLLALFLFIICCAAETWADPSLQINWVGAKRFEVKIADADADLDECINNGLEALYRYEVRLCHKDAYLFQKCRTEMIETHFLSYDALNQNYRLRLDRFRDNQEPRTDLFVNRDNAVAATRTISKIPLKVLLAGAGPLADDEHLYVRVIAECKGEYNETVSQLSSLITFGLVHPGRFDTGWTKYDLDRQP